MISINGVPVVPESFPDGTQKIDFSLGVSHGYMSQIKSCFPCCVFLKILKNIFRGYNKH